MSDEEQMAPIKVSSFAVASRVVTLEGICVLSSETDWQAAREISCAPDGFTEGNWGGEPPTSIFWGNCCPCSAKLGRRGQVEDCPPMATLPLCPATTDAPKESRVEVGRNYCGPDSICLSELPACLNV